MTFYAVNATRGQCVKLAQVDCFAGRDRAMSGGKSWSGCNHDNKALQCRDHKRSMGRRILMHPILLFGVALITDTAPASMFLFLSGFKE